MTVCSALSLNQFSVCRHANHFLNSAMLRIVPKVPPVAFPDDGASSVAAEILPTDRFGLVFDEAGVALPDKGSFINALVNCLAFGSWIDWSRRAFNADGLPERMGLGGRPLFPDLNIAPCCLCYRSSSLLDCVRCFLTSGGNLIVKCLPSRRFSFSKSAQ